MATSQYEKYIIRKPAVVTRVGDESIDVIPETDTIPLMSSVNTGPRVIYSQELAKSAKSKVEYGFILGDTILGNGQDFVPHKHDYEEIFLFLGTNPQDSQDLGAEVEFTLGEGSNIEKVTFKTSSSIYVPPGLAHFPQVFKNVKRPVMTMVIMPTVGSRDLQAVSMNGRI